MGYYDGAHELEDGPPLPLTTGFNHVATLTSDLDRLVDFYVTVFDGSVTFEV